MYKELSKHYKRTSDAIHHYYFKRKGDQLFFKGKDKPLINEDGKLKTFGRLKSILCKNRLHSLGFDVPIGELTAQQAVILNKAEEEELPSQSNVTKADDIELQEIMEDLIAQFRDHTQTQTDDLFKHPLRRLLGFDEELRSIWGLLKMQTAYRPS